jgi:hypothetical protein
MTRNSRSSSNADLGMSGHTDSTSPRSLLGLNKSGKKAFSPRSNAKQRQTTAAPSIGIYQANKKQQQHSRSPERRVTMASIPPTNAREPIYMDLDMVPRGSGVLPSTLKSSSSSSNVNTQPPPFGGVAPQTPPFGGVASNTSSQQTSPNYQSLELRPGMPAGQMSDGTTNAVVDDLLQVFFLGGGHYIYIYEDDVIDMYVWFFVCWCCRVWEVLRKEM